MSVSEAVRAPVACGVNVTVIEQLALTAIAVFTQLLLAEKSPGFAPPSAIFEMCRTAEPMFVTWKDCGVSAVPCAMGLKVRLPGEKASDGAGATPMPEREIDCGLPGALSLMFKTPDSCAAVVGEKVTLKEQLALGASAAVHVVD